VCSEGYSLHGHGQFECSVDGVWIGPDSEVIKTEPQCEGNIMHHVSRYGVLVKLH